MKNFFKKLSFVMAAAMVISSLYAPAAKAAAKDSITLKGKAISKKSIFVGGEKVNFDYKIGKFNNKGADGKWSTSDTSVITVNKHGVVTAVGTGDATLMLKVKKNTKKGIKKNYTFKVKLTAFARASKLEIPASDKAISLKVGETKDIIPTLTNKVDGVDHTYNLFAKSSDESVATVIAEGKKVTVEAKMASATPATITVFAAQKSNEDDAFDNKYKVEDTFTVTVVGDLSAEQSAANKIKVMGTDLVTDAAAYVVKNKKSDVKLVIKTVEVNAEKTEAILMGETVQFPEGEYTVTYKEKNADVKIEKSMSARFEITPADKAVAVLSGGKYTTAYVHYKVFDQFDNDITGTSLVNVKISGSNGATNSDPSDRSKIVFSDDNGFQLGLTKLSLNLYDLSNTTKSVSLSAVLDVTNEARVAEGSYVGLFDKDTGKFVESVDDETDFTKKNIYALFTFKDQYGGLVKAGANLKNELYVAATGLTGVTLTTDAEKIEDKTAKKEYVGFKLMTQSGATLRAGEVELRATIFANAAKSFTDKFQVTATPKVQDLSIYVGPKGFYAHQENELSFTALDQNGKAVTDFKVLNRVKFSDNNVKFHDDKGKGVLKYDATRVDVDGTSDSASKPVFFFATTEYNAIKQFNLTISKEKKVDNFLGLKDGTPLVVTSKNDLVIKFDDLDIRDQYNGAVKPADIKTLRYKVKVNVTNNSDTASFAAASSSPSPGTIGTEQEWEINETNLVTNPQNVVNVTAADGLAGDATLVLSLVDSSNKLVGKEKTYTISNVALKDVTDIKVEKFAFDDETTAQPASDLYADFSGKEPKITVTGMYKGKKVALVVNKDFTVNGKAANTVDVPESTTIEKGKTTAENKAFVTILTGKVLEHKYTYTNVPRHVAEVAIAKTQEDAGDKDKRWKVDLASGTEELSYTSTTPAGKIASFVEAKDQYKRTFADNETKNEAGKYFGLPTVIFSNYKDTELKVQNNGTTGAVLTVAGTGAAVGTYYEVDVTLIYPVTNKSITLHLKVKKAS